MEAEAAELHAYDDHVVKGLLRTESLTFIEKLLGER